MTLNKIILKFRLVIQVSNSVVLILNNYIVLPWALINLCMVKHIRSNQWDTVQFLLKLPPVVDENSELITFDVMFDGTQVFP